MSQKKIPSFELEQPYPKTKKKEDGDNEADGGGSKSKIDCFSSHKSVGIFDALPLEESVNAVRSALLSFGWRQSIL